MIARGKASRNVNMAMGEPGVLARWGEKLELSRGGAADNMRPMEGLRGLAVFLVFLVHYATLLKPWLPRATWLSAVLDAVHSIGNSGVDLFFVLSGYLIYKSLIEKPRSFRSFMERRVQRIYPAFLAVFFLYLALSYLYPSESKIPAQPGPAILYVSANLLFLPGLFPIDPIITVSWSLSFEMFFYVTTPGIVHALRLRERPVIARLRLLVGAAVLGCLAFGIFGGPIRLLMFISGMLLYEAMHSLPRAASMAPGLLGLIAGLLANLLPFDGVFGAVAKTSSLFVSYFMLCMTCFQLPRSTLGKAFSWTPVRWLGNISYSYYLIHGLALKAAFLFLTRAITPQELGSVTIALLLPLAFFLTLLPSVALFLLVERPFSLFHGSERETSDTKRHVASTP